LISHINQRQQGTETYKSNTVHQETGRSHIFDVNPFVPLNKLIDIAVVHPFGYHCESVRFQIHANHW